MKALVEGMLFLSPTTQCSFFITNSRPVTVLHSGNALFYCDILLFTQAVTNVFVILGWMSLFATLLTYTHSLHSQSARISATKDVKDCNSTNNDVLRDQWYPESAL